MLPPLSPAEQRHSAALARRIREQLLGAGGWLSFERFMDLALYAPGLGYYSAGATKLGAAGDFVTAPEVSDLFGRCLARQCAAGCGRWCRRCGGAGGARRCGRSLLRHGRRL